jgi:large subunit ribosomal protein L24
MLGIKKGDQVYVISGKDRGKTGKVVEIFKSKDYLLVENINIVKKSVKKSDENPHGGYIQIEKPIHISNVMLFDPKLNKPTRFRTSINNGIKKRVSVKSGEVIK